MGGEGVTWDWDGWRRGGDGDEEGLSRELVKMVNEERRGGWEGGLDEPTSFFPKSWH